MALLDVTSQQVMQVVHNLNSRLMKCLGFKTPNEAFRQLAGVDAGKILGYALLT